MDPYADSTAYTERPVSFGRDGRLVGIVTEPTAGVHGIPVVILGAGILHRIGPSRASVLLARTLAAAGHPTLRFDLSGIGDSPRAQEVDLEDAVVNDITDAIELAVGTALGSHWEGQSLLIGFCSGADNALHVGSSDPRVRGLVLMDPTIHRTAGFVRRDLWRRLTDPKSWWSVLSGRALRVRVSALTQDRSEVRPPNYYGLLTGTASETDLRVAAFVRSDGQILYLLTSGVHDYCNAAAQIRESLPFGFRSSHIDVEWAPEMSHTVNRRGDLLWLIGQVEGWLERHGHRSSLPAVTQAMAVR